MHKDTYVRVLEEQTVDNWLAALREIESVPKSIHEVTESFSWKITKPIRVIRTIQLKVKNKLSKLFV